VSRVRLIARLCQPSGRRNDPFLDIWQTACLKLWQFCIIVSSALRSRLQKTATCLLLFGWLVAPSQAQIGPPPVITVQPVSQTVILLGAATFSVTASSQTTMTYQWFKDGAAIAGATSSSYTILSVLGSDAGTYYVKVTNAGGSVNSDTATLNLFLPPSITSQPQNQQVVQGQNASFSVTVTGSGPFAYRWRFNGSAISGGTSATLNLTNVQPARAGNYTVVVTNAAGSVTSAVATLTVYVPPTIATQPANQTVNQGQNASFSVVPGGSAPFSYQWNFNGAPLAGASNSSLLLTNVQASRAGNYNVVVTNPAGSVTSQVATLTVNVPPTITTQPQSQFVIQGQPLTLSVIATGTTPFTYNWYFNGSHAGPNNATWSFGSVNTGNAGSYYVVVGNSAGSATSAVAVVTVCVPPSIQTQPNNQTANEGQNAGFSVTANGSAPLSYQWNFNGSPLAGASASLALTNVDPTQAGSYSVVVTNAGGSVTSRVVTLTVVVPPTITTQPQSQSLTSHQNLSLTVAASGTGPFTYRWYFNGAHLGPNNPTLTVNDVNGGDAGNYWVTVANAAGTATSEVAVVVVDVPAGIATQPQSQVILPGQDASFTVVPSGTPSFDYQWYFNGAPVGPDSPTLTISGAQDSDTGSYYVVVSNNWGSVTSAVATLSFAVPPAIVAQPQDQTVASGQPTLFSVTVTGTGPLSYQWNLNSAALPGATNLALILTDAQLTDAGAYSVVVTNIAGSVTSSVAMLTVTNPVPVIASVLNDATLTPNGFAFQASMPLGHTYIVFATPDLQTWTPIATNVATSANISFMDPAATNAPMRFYRILVQ